MGRIQQCGGEGRPVIKNTAGQKVGAQMVSASDGSAFTGSVTVAVTVDAGTQATGTVGSGACTHEGNGFHTYAPSQAETNGDHLAFTFTGSGAIPATVQVYTVAGDAFTRLGAPAGASVSADIAAVKSETADILDDTGTSGVALPDGVITANKIASNAITSAKIAADAIGASQIAADAIGSSELAASAITEIQSGLSTLDAAGVRSAVGLGSANLDTQLSTIDTVVDAILVDTGTTLDGRIPAALVSGRMDASVGAMAANVLTASALAADAVDEILDEQIGDSTITVRQALRVFMAALAGKASGAATTTMTFRNVADDTNRIVATVDADGNRSAITLNV
jgi:hypothetical protein